MPRKSSAEVLVQDIIDICSAPAVTEGDKKTCMTPFIKIARWIPRWVSPYVEFDHIIHAGINEVDPDGDKEEIRSHKRHREIFESIMDINGKFYTVVDALQTVDDNGDSLKKFIKTLEHYKNEARSQDTNSIKFTIITFLPVDPETESVMPPLVGREKSARGWSHIWTARALCPIADLSKFDRNPSHYMKQVQGGKIKPRYSDFPSFLYEDGSYDPAHTEQGLFRGHVLIRVLRTIYTGKSSTFTGHRHGNRPSQAELHNVDRVIPEMIAYAACQAYAGISSMDKWQNRDNYFNLEKFFKAIVNLFTKRPDHPWASETLAYLTSALPTLKRRSKRKRGDVSSDGSDPDDSDADPTGILTALDCEDEQGEEEETAGDSERAPLTPPRTSQPPPQPSPAPTQSGAQDDQEHEDEEETIPRIARSVRGGSRGRGNGGRGRAGGRGGGKQRGRAGGM